MKSLSGIDAASLGLLAADRQRLLARLADRLGIDLPSLRPPTYEVYSGVFQKGELTGSTAPVDPPDEAGVIRRALELPCSARDAEAETIWLMRSAWKVDPSPVWSAGVAALETGVLYGRPAVALAGALARAGLLPSLDELLAAPRSVRQYPTLFAPAASVLAGWVLERHGEEGLRRAASAPSGGEARSVATALGIGEPELRTAYAGALEREASRWPRALAREKAISPQGRQRGVCYAHTVSLRRGYASEASARSLDRLASLGVNWISITPFGYLELHSPEIAASSGFGAEGETDESLAVVIGQARARGIEVLLKPHLWSTDFVGRVSMRSEADWQRFFVEYGRFVAHHAILGEACGAAALCVGNEMIEATRGQEDRWRALIAAVRHVFAGPLTYGAHWEEEVERIHFWDALDWVGVSLYAPLAPPTAPVPAGARPGETAPGEAREAASAGTGPTAAPPGWVRAARLQAERLGGIARRAGKPLLVVEAGFPSHPRAAQAPWEDPDDGPADDAAQAEAFEALFTALWPQPFLAGIYWWKWFTDEPRPPGDRSHCFAGKQAEQVVRRFYRGR